MVGERIPDHRAGAVEAAGIGRVPVQDDGLALELNGNPVGVGEEDLLGCQREATGGFHPQALTKAFTKDLSHVPFEISRSWRGGEQRRRRLARLQLRPQFAEDKRTATTFWIIGRHTVKVSSIQAKQVRRVNQNQSKRGYLHVVAGTPGAETEAGLFSKQT